MFAWYKAVWPAFVETTRHWVEIPKDAELAGGCLRTGLPASDDTTAKALYPVAWFLAQQKLVQALLDNEPPADAAPDSRLYWSLMLMATVGEGLFAFNASELLWGRALFGVPPWSAKAIDPKYRPGAQRPIPPDYYNSPSMQRLYNAGAKVLAKRKALGITPKRGVVPFREGQTVLKCSAADVAEMRSTGYWQDAWAKGARVRSSSVGPLAMGCGTMNAAPFLELPLLNDIAYARPQWWLYGNMRLQPMHIPWSKGSTFKALYNQPLGIVARRPVYFPKGSHSHATFVDTGDSVSRFIEDKVATQARDALYAAPSIAPVGFKEYAEFMAFMAAKWSFLAFAYQRDDIGDSGEIGGPSYIDMKRGGLISYGSPFDPYGSANFEVPRGLRFIPTLQELVRDTAPSVAFSVAWLSGEYRMWGEWFAAIDYPELVNTIQSDWINFIANGQQPGNIPFVQAYLGHDDMRRIRSGDSRSRLIGQLSPIVSAIGALVDAWYGNYASAAGNLKATYEGASAQLKHGEDVTPSDVFVEMPDDTFLRSGGIPTDPKADKFGKSMTFLSSTHGNSAVVLRRYAAAFDNIVRAVRAAMPPRPLFKPGQLVSKIVSVQRQPPPGTVQAPKAAASSAPRAFARVGVWAVAGSIVAGGAWLLRKRVRS